MGRIVLKNVEKRYGKDKQYAVKDFNLEIEDGEFLVMVGGSGCGKSTTLRMIAGLEDITSGELYIGDKLVNDLPPKDRDIAMVFQNYALYPNMNIYENIAFGLRLRKEPKHEIDMSVKGTSRILEIEQYLDRKPRQLSGGQRQRVALGRAIVRKPSVFLMDEPLSNLDAKLRVQMRTEIIRLHKQLGVTTVYVTHDQVEAMTMGNRIVVMKDGVIQQVDSPRVIYSNPRNMFVASFIGTPPINFIEGKIVESDGGRLQLQTQRSYLEIPDAHAELLRKHGKVNRRVVLGIRSEFAHVEPEMTDRHPKSQITGTLKVAELMGADMYLYVDIGTDKPFVVRTLSGFDRSEDERITVALDMSKALYFDKDTTESLMYE
ncbi:sn-glycerol-3-phosphate ABC transporter ATP-binding protein UgpC [Paenibacillus sp. N4]|uniref:ABC transporter ATP-binding protein n=1 Tax=Paenibacillus vietnamensis TaxID=2590547 RepID=UPI001CD0F883|nr:sn-glycerol-3-phosphate ABC transporter ATP-binding protein UgpC [Paenibacillus vietnamensis]MCA0758628.1 sn-glycerol-3-phosphate ABC transporter ATP-binding protein UgpC [Paenibacillus vietnamensis]